MCLMLFLFATSFPSYLSFNQHFLLCLPQYSLFQFPHPILPLSPIILHSLTVLAPSPSNPQMLIEAPLWTRDDARELLALFSAYFASPSPFLSLL